MNAPEYYRTLKHFVEVHGISRDPWSRLEKAQEEVGELEDAILSGDRDNIINEAADLLNVCADIILSQGGNPLWRGYLKLEEAAARPEYQLIAAKVAALKVEGGKP